MPLAIRHSPMKNNLRHMTAKLPQTSELQKPSKKARRTRSQPVSVRGSLPARLAKRRRSPAKPWNWPPVLVALTAFSSGISLLAGGAWVSVQFMMNPNAFAGLNAQLLEPTESAPADGQPIESLTAIRAQLQQEGVQPAPTIPLKVPGAGANAPADLLMRLMVETAPPKSLICQSPCQQLSELRVYQPVPVAEAKDAKNRQTEQFVRLVSQVSLEGPAESFVIAPLVQSKSNRQGSNRPQALTALEGFRGEPPATKGVWLNLTGYRREGEATIAYGQVFHYNPERTNLSFMAQWTSTAGKLPAWQEVTGDGNPELVVDQSNGIEPKFVVYQLQSRNFLPNPIQLEEISLKEAVLDKSEPAGLSYNQALQLARIGLWSPALKQMEAVKQRRIQSKQEWPEAAQSQLDVIQLHAQIAQTQADAAETDPAQKAYNALLDGRWEEALKIFEADLDNANSIAIALKADKGRLWKRVEGAMKINPETAVRGWGALILAAQQGKPQAQAWLKQQTVPVGGSQDASGVQSAEMLLERLEVALSESTLINHPSQIVGSATPTFEINGADWLKPKQDTSLQLSKGQVWYQVQVAGFHDGQRWLRGLFSNLQVPRIEPGRRLWRILGLNLNSQIQVAAWMPDGTQKTAMATVKAVSFNNGTLQLLAAGEPIPGATPADNLGAGGTVPRPVAFTADKFRWLEPASITMTELNQQQSSWVSAILSNLWRELQAAGSLPGGSVPSSEEMLLESGNWQVQSIDLNGNQVPDAVLTLRPDLYANWNQSGASVAGSDNSSRTRTLIFDDAGKLLYSEFTSGAGQSLTGFADLEDGGPVALVVDGANGYSLKRWVSEKSRFE
ncbi:hypothetical protein [Microcoleus sp. FACHB-68]|uniref:tetratricopeptide repeat protein n=1 Tax=Microcoleus sp. FACHB-68 TaxID=2692826 RepID=UPI00168335B6|nr:hypothetical protein [Microcoleus sp. FACHB-68]MBD1936494.1 hypothetical protein [Microcoleus sp. FACHB-68]